MSDKVQLIKEEIKRRISYLEELGDREYIEKYFEEQFRFIEIYESLIKFIDSLPEEHNEDLEEYAKKLAKGAALDRHNLIWMCKKGAEWQKQQMIKDTVVTTIVNDWQYGIDPDHAVIPAIHKRIDGFNVGDKVKIIIIKTK